MLLGSHRDNESFWKIPFLFGLQLIIFFLSFVLPLLFNVFVLNLNTKINSYIHLAKIIVKRGFFIALQIFGTTNVFCPPNSVEALAINAGITQRSLLSLTFFLLYINICQRVNSDHSWMSILMIQRYIGVHLQNS